MFKQIAIFLLLITVPLTAKIRIFTIAFSRPELIPLQKASLEYFCQDEYEWIVYNNARAREIAESINSTCANCGVECRRIRSGMHPELGIHGNAINFALKDILSEYRGKLVLFENDDFLIQPISFEERMSEYDLAFIPHTWGYPLATGMWHLMGPKALYCHPNVVYFNLETLPNPEEMDWSRGDVGEYHLDTGGRMHTYLLKYPNIKKYYIDTLPDYATYLWKKKYSLKKFPLQAPEEYTPILEKFVNTYGAHVQINLQSHILHYGAASSWDGASREYHESKFAAFTECLHDIIEAHKSLTQEAVH